MNKADVIERLEEMETYLRNKSYSDLKARDYCEWVGYALALLREQEPVIVRCKDCKHHRENICEVLIGIYDPDWFCADGERR